MPPQKRRTHVVRVPVTHEELRTLRRLAKRLGVTMAAALRRTIYEAGRESRAA